MRRLIALVLVAVLGSSCVYYNTFYSARKYYNRATAGEPGPRVFSFRVAPQQGEVVTQNNQRDSLVEVRDTRERIALIFEDIDGTPPRTPWQQAELDRVLNAVGELSACLTRLSSSGLNSPFFTSSSS